MRNVILLSMKQLLLLLFLIFSLHGYAQQQGIVYHSYTDVVTGTISTHLQDVEIRKRTSEQMVWNGGREFKLSSGDKVIDKKIKKEFAAIAVNDTLYLNTHKLKSKGARFGNGYVNAFVEDSIIIFSTYPLPSDGAALGASMFGAIGASIEMSNRIKNIAFYEFYPEDVKSITLIRPDRMRELLADYPELLKQFDEEEKMRDREKVNKYMLLWQEAKRN